MSYITHSDFWIDWCRNSPSSVLICEELPDEDRYILGYLIQAFVECPEEAMRVFGPITNGDRVNPLVQADLDWLVSLIRNGIRDDWELFLQWTQEGYIVTNDANRRPQDARFRESEALRVLDLLCGGRRTIVPPEQEMKLIQDAFERLHF